MQGPATNAISMARGAPAPPISRCPVVVIASSAGGLAALRRVLSRLPPGFPAAVLIVQHLAPHAHSALADIFGRVSALPVHQARDGEVYLPGNVYLAPPDHHLLVTGQGTLALSHEPAEHFVRPSANVLFRSVAEHRSQSSIAVVLTGSGVDGAAGVQAVARAGGVVIAQDEATSEYFSMPSAAIHTGVVGFILPLGAIAS